MVPSFPSDINGSKHVGILFETAKPGINESTLQYFQHTYPAYRDSLSKTTPDSLDRALELRPSYNYFGSAWSGFKNVIGTPRAYLYDYLSEELIEYVEKEVKKI